MFHVRTLVTVALLAACGPKHSGGSSGDDACAKAARNTYKAGEGRAEVGSREYTVSVDAMAEVCRTDHWSDTQITCMTNATDLKSDDSCGKLFTEQQIQHVEHAFEAGRRDREQREQAEQSAATTGSSSAPPAAPAGQDKLTAEDTQASLEIAKGIIKLLAMLPKGYADIRGDLLESDAGSSTYGVKNTSFMLADQEAVMTKSGGGAYYLASYSGTKKLTMSFSAFTGGITLVTNNDGNFSVAQDTSASSGDDAVWVLKLKGVTVGKYTLSAKKAEGTLILGIL